MGKRTEDREGHEEDETDTGNKDNHKGKWVGG